MSKTTESGSGRRGLETWSTLDLLQCINAEDKKVAEAVEKAGGSVTVIASAKTGEAAE